MASTRPKRTKIMIAILPDEASAFEAYQLLWRSGISPEHLALVGNGYTSPDRVGLLQPTYFIQRYARYGAYLGAGLGAVLGWAIAQIGPVGPLTGWRAQLFALLLGVLALGLLGGLLGATYGVLFKVGTSIACLNSLRQGQYLLLLEGSESLTRRAREILSGYTIPEREA